MISKNQTSKASKSRKVLLDGLEQNDNLDIIDLLNCEQDKIENIKERIQEISADQATKTYIYNLVQISDMLLNNIYTDFLDSEM
jgi:hypothetical protein